MNEFAKTAKQLARNPLGIIALFLVLVYAIAALLLKFSGDLLTAEQRWPLVYFIVFFPILVLAVFAWLVIGHSTKLYSPSDFKTEDGFFRSINISSPSKEKSERSRPTKQELIADQNFGAERVIIDGKRFLRCAFRSSTLVFEGREPVAMEESIFVDTSWQLEGSAALTIDFLKTLHQSSDQGQTLVENSFSWLKGKAPKVK